MCLTVNNSLRSPRRNKNGDYIVYKILNRCPTTIEGEYDFISPYQGGMPWVSGECISTYLPPFSRHQKLTKGNLVFEGFHSFPLLREAILHEELYTTMLETRYDVCIFRATFKPEYLIAKGRFSGLRSVVSSRLTIDLEKPIWESNATLGEE